jgi:hypothetical protein
MVDILVPISLFAMIFGIYYLRTRERLAMIEKGLSPAENDGRPKPFINLKWALLLMGSGLGLLTAYLLMRMGLADRYTNDDQGHSGAFNPVFLYFALIAIGGGLGLYLSYRIERKEWLSRQQGNPKTGQ